MDLIRVRAKIREIRESLTDEFPWLMSVANVEKGSTAGTLTQADRTGAAQCIADGTHRLATEDEIKAHLDAEAAIRKAAEDKTNATNLLVEGVGNLFRRHEDKPAAAKPDKSAK